MSRKGPWGGQSISIVDVKTRLCKVELELTRIEKIPEGKMNSENVQNTTLLDRRDI